MNKKTLTALKGSIRKWRGIVAGKVEDKGTANCSLCKLFNFTFDCVGCPVMKKTGKPGCRGTPYTSWYDAGGFHNFAHTPDLKGLAAAELKFLQSLLPKTKKRGARKAAR